MYPCRWNRPCHGDSSSLMWLSTTWCDFSVLLLWHGDDVTFPTWCDLSTVLVSLVAFLAGVVTSLYCWHDCIIPYIPDADLVISMELGGCVWLCHGFASQPVVFHHVFDSNSLKNRRPVVPFWNIGGLKERTKAKSGFRLGKLGNPWRNSGLALPSCSFSTSFWAKHVPSNPDVAPHLKRIIIIIIIILVLDREWGNDPKDPIHILNLSE